MLPSKCCPGKQLRLPKTVPKKPLQLDSTFWIEHGTRNLDSCGWSWFSQRFKIYMRGSIYLRISTAFHSNPRQAKPRWDVEQNSVKFLDTIIHEHFFNGKTWHINSLSLLVTTEIRCELFFCIKFYFSFCSSFFVLNRHGWKPFFILDIIWFLLLFFHRMDIWSLKSFFLWVDAVTRVKHEGFCIMQSHVVDQTHHQPDIIMSTTNIMITIIIKIIVIVILTIISAPCFSSRHIRHITMDLLSSNLWKGHGRRHEAIQQCSRSFTKSERTHDRMKPNICSKRSCMMIYICVWQNKMPFLRACKFLSNYMGAMLYDNWQISKTLLAQNLRQDLSVDSGRTCKTCKARVEGLKLGHELLFTKEIFNIKLFHLAMKDLQW